jgi:hypothetical protein
MCMDNASSNLPVMIKTAGLAICSIVLGLAPAAWGQSKAASANDICKEERQVYRPEDFPPYLPWNKRPRDLPSVIIGDFELVTGILVRIQEIPYSGEKHDQFRPLLVIRQPRDKLQSYDITELLKGADRFRFMGESERVCGPSEEGALFLAYGTVPSALRVGFVRVHYSAGSVDVVALPLVNQGKIVLSRANLSEAELWSATGPSAAPSKRKYEVSKCEVTSGTVECEREPGEERIADPRDFDEHRIEVK